MQLGPIKLSLSSLYVQLITTVIVLVPALFIKLLLDKLDPVYKVLLKNKSSHNGKIGLKTRYTARILAYILGFLGAAVSLLFTIFYSLQMTHKQTSEWIGSQIMGFLSENFIVPFIKIAVMIFFLQQLKKCKKS